MILSLILLSCESLVLPKENAAKNDIIALRSIYVLSYGVVK